MPDDIVSSRIRPAIVYVIVAHVPHRIVKIGITRTLERRLYSIALGVPFDPQAEVFFSLTLPSKEEAIRVERSAHQDHAAQRLKGEWFDIDPEAAKASVLRHSKNLALSRQDAPLKPAKPKPPRIKQLDADKLPQVNVRLPEVYHPLIRSIAHRLRESNGAAFAARLQRLLGDKPAPVDVNDLAARVESLEAIINGLKKLENGR